MDLPLPIYAVLPAVQNEIGLFEPGIRLENRDGALLASVKVTPDSRYYPRGLSKWLGLYKNRALYERTRYTLLMRQEEQILWRVEAWAKHWGARPQAEVQASNGTPVGRFIRKSPAFRMLQDAKTTIFEDERGTPVGYFEVKMSLTSGSCRIVDSLRGWEYDLAGGRTPDEPIVIRSQDTHVIDSRLLFAWCFDCRFCDEED